MEHSVCALLVKIRSSLVKQVSGRGSDDRLQIVVVSCYLTQVQINEILTGNGVCYQSSLQLGCCCGKRIDAHCEM